MFRRSCKLSCDFFAGKNCAMDRDLSHMLANNKKWVEHVRNKNPDYFKSLASGQSPKFLYVGCSDSRVDPGKLTGLDLGELFVHRNVGNLCPNDLNFLSVLEYAVGVLKVPHIIVCGHYDCGAVRNSVSHQTSGLLDNWVRNIRDVHRLYEAEILTIRVSQGEEAALRRLVEVNVIEQCLNIFKTYAVQSQRMENSKVPPAERDYSFLTPRIHACVFDPADGVLKKLDIDFQTEIAKFHGLYDLL